MIDPRKAEITQKIAINIVLHSLGEQMYSLITSYLVRHYSVSISENGDLSCPLYELRLALDHLIGKNAAHLVIQDIYVEIDALTDMMKKEG